MKQNKLIKILLLENKMLACVLHDINNVIALGLQCKYVSSNNIEKEQKQIHQRMVYKFPQTSEA